ncbi:uroporphyrinogen-III C-methyltransferase [Thermomonas mangrovi]|uniref:uroporphyrinogen-III C-methyltransferase n=1 Tax=Thermomonas mangrovi TaxID=2993316 RepID=UPI0023080307
MDAPSPSPPRRSRAGSLLLLALVLLALAAAGGWAWQHWQQAQARASAAADARQSAMAARLDALRVAQRAQAQRLQQAEATNRLLRDELLGIGQRAALLEDSVSRLADPDRHGAQALRLDELELLLAIGQQRLRLDDDVEGAHRALALAAPLLAGIDDPAYLSLRQTLVQEQAALEALGPDPRLRAATLLAGLERGLQAPAPVLAAGDPQRPWYARLLDRVVTVQPTASAGLRAGTDREAAFAAAQVDIALARAAIERRDGVALGLALDRIGAWQRRLLAGSPMLAAQQRELATLRALALRHDSPLAGSSLQQLRALRGR